MRRTITVLAAAWLCACQPGQTVAAPPGQSASPVVTPCFEPDDDCIAVLVREIAHSRREILIHAYAFTSGRVIDALYEAVDRGVHVRMIIDRSREGSPRIAALEDRGVEILTDADVSLQHNKIMIFDRERISTGSQNFTKGSENNAENLIVIHDAPTVRAFTENWLKRAAASRRFIPQVPTVTSDED